MARPGQSEGSPAWLGRPTLSRSSPCLPAATRTRGRGTADRHTLDDHGRQGGHDGVITLGAGVLVNVEERPSVRRDPCGTSVLWCWRLSRGERVAGVARVMKVEGLEASHLRGLIPVAIEGLAVERLMQRAAEDQAVRSRTRVMIKMRLQFADKRPRGWRRCGNRRRSWADPGRDHPRTTPGTARRLGPSWHRDQGDGA